MSSTINLNSGNNTFVAAAADAANRKANNHSDSLARLKVTHLRGGSGALLNSHAYGYNYAHQRTSVTNVFTNRWEHAYVSAGQVTNAVGKTSGGSLRLHEQPSYTCVPAGNLSQRIAYGLTNLFSVHDVNETRRSRFPASTCAVPIRMRWSGKWQQLLQHARRRPERLPRRY